MTTTVKYPIKVSNDLIRSYYYNEFDQKKDHNSGIVIDDACYELRFVKEKNVKFINGNNESFLLPSSFTLINPKAPFRFEFNNTYTIFCIKIQPWMNASYVPTQKGKVLDLNDLYPKKIDKLHESFFNAISVDEMVDHAEDFLVALQISPNKEIELIQNICSLIYEKSGDISVQEISEKFNIYRQKLNQLFKKEVKYTLKTFINCVRIRACLSHKLKNPEISLTEIGIQFGFYDQAHFIHSFKNACGISPSAYINNSGYSLTSPLFRK